MRYVVLEMSPPRRAKRRGGKLTSLRFVLDSLPFRATIILCTVARRCKRPSARLEADHVSAYPR